MFSALCISGFFHFLQTAVFAVGYISGTSLFPEPLSSEEERIYLEKLSTGDEDARNILIERNLRLVAHVCKKYSNSNVDQDDLISIGTIGLIKGINSFKPEKGARLSTYVSRCIDNEILMHFRATKKQNAEVFLDEPIGKDKDDNVITLQEILENDDRSVEESVDLKMKVKLLPTPNQLEISYHTSNAKVKIKGEKLGSVGNYAIEGIPPVNDLEIYTTNGKIEVE